MERGRLGARGIVVLGLLGALLVVLQVAMEFELAIDFIFQG